MSAGGNPEPIDSTTLVDAVMRRHPATIAVFLRLRLHCVGCPIGAFHSVADAAREHGIDAGVLLGELRASLDVRPA
jgi:hybrid cluster-associated redox disulfide protein